MSQNEHIIVAVIIGLIIQQFIWHRFIKNHPATKKNKKEWYKILGKFL